MEGTEVALGVGGTYIIFLAASATVLRAIKGPRRAELLVARVNLSGT